MKQLGSGGWLTNLYVMLCYLRCCYCLLLCFAYSTAKRPENWMNDDDLGKCNGGTLAGTASPRDRHTEREKNVKEVIIVVIT